MIACGAEAPPPAGLGGIVGSYTNADLGKISIRVGPKGARLDAGEWSSAIGQKRDADGSVNVVLLEPPLADTSLLIGGEDQAHRTLTLLDDQVKYVFTRVD